MSITRGKLDELKDKVLPLLLPYGVRKVSLFGSVARGDDGPDSDVDILVEFTEPRLKPLGLLGWVQLEDELSRIIGRRADLVSAQGLCRHMRPYVEKELVVLYETT